MITKEIKDLTGLDISRLKDKKVRIKLIRRSLPYVIFGYAGDLLSHAYRTSTASGGMGRLMDTLGSLGEVIAHPVPSMHLRDILFGIATGIGIRLVVYFKGKNAKKYRKGKEYGSALLLSSAQQSLRLFRLNLSMKRDDASIDLSLHLSCLFDSMSLKIYQHQNLLKVAL